ncbi:MAG: di-trans,poly-cis-decaprenylcistransferase [Alphaproteobacteria bacterium]|nr:di-trans,poly-cis-decaprenylcistransferase [Alphaproteobacteria bacterium]
MTDLPPAPKSVAIIMDGNGRWAEARGLPRVEGHAEGAQSVKEIVTRCRERGVKSLTLYSFSTENWRRPAAEVSALMKLLQRYVFEERETILKNGIQLRVIGQPDRLPVFVRKPLRLLVKDSADNRDMTLCLALSYGGRQELVEAMRQLGREVRAGRLDPERIDEAMISAHLQTRGMPDPDLLIRTSGEIRVSNFLLWQIAYSELYVTDTAWPDFRVPQLEAAFAAYGGRERRFGRTGVQTRSDDADPTPTASTPTPGA